MTTQDDRPPVDDGGPAFPTEVGHDPEGRGWHQTGPSQAHFHGMSLRDYFAAWALGYMNGRSQIAGPKRLAEDAYELADAMLAARKAGAA